LLIIILEKKLYSQFVPTFSFLFVSMEGKYLASFFLLGCLIFGVNSQGIGDRLVHTALLYKVLPLTVDEAIQSGYSNYTDCNPYVGIAYSAETGGPTEGYPITVYFTSGGQIAGIGMTHYGQPAFGLENYWIEQADGTFLITVSFRDPKGICNGYTYEELVGDRVVINQNGGEVDYNFPLTSEEATQQSFTQGGCINSMGIHWSLDLSTAPVMSWNASNFMPVVAMYNQGVISAFFITTPNLQYGEPFGPWEGPIPSFLMCRNWCDDSCSWNVNFWSVLHFFLTDPSLNNCPSRC